MKKKPATTPALAGDSTAAAGVSKLTEGKSPLPSETLLQLGALYAGADVAAMLGEESEAVTARGVQAGLVATLHAVLPPAQFRSVMIQWEVDAIKLSELLDIAGANQQERTEGTEAINV
jgi:hypothetical protein